MSYILQTVRLLRLEQVAFPTIIAIAAGLIETMRNSGNINKPSFERIKVIIRIVNQSETQLCRQ